jgi:histidinol-phosphate/aromatic aminotransferase/cobyric acid decarboxylase-like protein
MNSMAEHFMEILLKHRNEIQKSFDDTVRDREKFSKDLEESPIVCRVLSSGANFVTCELSISENELLQLQRRLLSEHKIFIKNATDKFDDANAYIRLAVRTPDENACLVDLLNPKLLP